MRLDIGKYPQCQQRGVQNHSRQHAAVGRLRIRAQPLQFMNRVAQHRQVGLGKKGDPGIDIREPVVDHGGARRALMVTRM